jgi:asparagine synthase (glutamine-hydrolysing)
MCGIAGEVRARPPDGAPPAGRRELVAAMVAAMRHRGPDDQGIIVDGPAVLGMCRLAIIDIAGGAQPMATPDGRFQIVYNGECYAVESLRRELEGRGCRFRSHSDTEVVLHAIAEYGTAGLSRLNGMFAFAVWDRRERELLLVRDRLGIKPLFYWQDGDRLVFSSTLGSIAGRSDFVGTIDPEAVELYLSHRFVAAPHTMYREIRKLPAGCLARFRDGTLRVETWWDVPLGAEPRAIGLDQAAEEVDALLRDAARARLVSERPVGLFLSGGIDSGLLAAALAGEQLETFSLGFDDPAYDEAASAARVAGSLGLRHHVLRAELDAERDLDAVLCHFDEPVGDPSGMALYELSRLVSRHVTVALSGTGGDELFGGYRRVLAGLLARGTRWVPALRALPRWLGRDESKLGWRGQLARLAATAGSPPLECYRALIGPTSEPFGRALRRPELTRSLDGFTAASAFARHFERAEDRSLLTRLLYTDLKTVLAEDYLVKEDRMTMAHSVEGRVPFLDHRLVELAFSLPDRHKLRGLTGKVVLRRLAASRLPPEVARAPKQGFEIPVAQWLRGDLAPRVRALASASARIAEFVQPAAVADAVDAHLDGRADHGRLLWTLLTLEAWLTRSGPPGPSRQVAPIVADAVAPRPLKLMVVSSSLGEGGAQRVASTLLAHLDRRRFAPTLCLFKPTIGFPLPDDVEMTVLGAARDRPVSDLVRRRPWLAAELPLRLRRHIAAERPDVILSCMDQVNAVTGTALVGMSDRPRWVARIGSDPARQGRAAAAWAGWALRAADAVVVSSPELGDGLARRYPGTRGRLRAATNPTDFERIDLLAAAPPSRRRDPATPLVVSVGRLSPEKRPDLMLAAIDRVRRRSPVDLWLCGDGPLVGEVRARIASLGLEAHVALLGFCDNPYALLRQADVFLLASDFEGLPNALIEAQGLGVAAVATDCRYGPAQVVAHGETGLLVPPGDAGAMAAAIEALLGDPSRRAAMGDAARLRARARYGVAARLPDWEAVLAGEVG